MVGVLKLILPLTESLTGQEKTRHREYYGRRGTFLRQYP